MFAIEHNYRIELRIPQIHDIPITYLMVFMTTL